MDIWGYAWLERLVSGTIIYDKSSRFTELRNNNIDKYKPIDNLLLIDNLNELDIIHNKNYSLKKHDK